MKNKFKYFKHGEDYFVLIEDGGRHYAWDIGAQRDTSYKFLYGRYLRSITKTYLEESIEIPMEEFIKNVNEAELVVPDKLFEQELESREYKMLFKLDELNHEVTFPESDDKAKFIVYSVKNRTGNPAFRLTEEEIEECMRRRLYPIYIDEYPMRYAFFSFTRNNYWLHCEEVCTQSDGTYIMIVHKMRCKYSGIE